MGWDILDWVSTADDDFNRELGFLHTEEELKPFLEGGEIPPAVEQMAERSGTDVKGYVTEGPGLSAYALSDGTVYRTYVTTARGLRGPRWPTTGLLDRTPKGPPRGRAGAIWLRRHDEYEAALALVRRGGAVGEDQRVPAGLDPAGRDRGISREELLKRVPLLLSGDHPEGIAPGSIPGT